MIQKRKNSFETQASAPLSLEMVVVAFLALRTETERNGLQDISLKDINKEINQARKDLRKYSKYVNTKGPTDDGNAALSGVFCVRCIGKYALAGNVSMFA